MYKRNSTNQRDKNNEQRIWTIKSQKKFKWSINMKRHLTSLIKKCKFKQDYAYQIGKKWKRKTKENEQYETLGGQCGSSIIILNEHVFSAILLM